MNPIPDNEPTSVHADKARKVVYDAIMIDDQEGEVPAANASQQQPTKVKPPFPNHAEAPRASLIERLLSPRSLQVVMSAGGGVLVIGLAVWLWSMGLFDNPLIAAVSMGIGNLVFLAIGIFLFTQTRYQLAGRGLTLLSTLTLPLNLWFYDAQGLISVDQGGNLWIPALFICGILAATARATRDAMFAYTFVGGVVLTGLLFLANPTIGSLWTATSLSLFLVVTGGIAIHAINVFSESDGAFSRKQFGTAFFNAGHIVLISGLAVLCIRHVSHFASISEMAPGNLLCSIGTLAVAAYCYLFSYLNEKRNSGFFVFLASAVGIWISATVLDFFAVELTFNFVLCLVALAILAQNVWVGISAKRQASSTAKFDSPLPSVGLPVVGMALAMLGLGQSLLAIHASSTFWNGTFCTQLVLSMMAMVSFPGAWRKTDGDSSSAESIGGTIGLITGAICLGVFPAVIAVKVFHLSALIALFCVLLIPALLLAVAFAKVVSMEPSRCREAALVSTTATLMTTLVPLQSGALVFAAWPTIAMFTAIAAIYFVIAQASANRGDGGGSMQILGAVFGTLVSLITVVQVATVLEIASAHLLLNSLAAIGIVIIGMSKALKFTRAETNGKYQAVTGHKDTNSQDSVLAIGNVFLVTASVGTILFVGTQILNGSAGFTEVGLLSIQLVAVGLAWVANTSTAWRQSYIVSSTVMACLAMTVLISEIDLSPVQMIELVSVLGGLVAIVAAYAGWSQEKTQSNEWVSVGFGVGAMLMAMPMVLGIVGYRMMDVEIADHVWRQIHEVGALVIGLGLLTSGVLTKVRSTTIGGALVMVAYIASMLFLIQLPEQLQSVSVLLMLGGGLVFGSGILLSLYRDRLLALPDKIRQGSGVFSFLKWR